MTIASPFRAGESTVSVGNGRRERGRAVAGLSRYGSLLTICANSSSLKAFSV